MTGTSRSPTATTPTTAITSHNDIQCSGSQRQSDPMSRKAVVNRAAGRAVPRDVPVFTDHPPEAARRG